MNNFKFVELRKILIADTYMGFLTLFTNMLHGSNQRLVVESKMCKAKQILKVFCPGDLKDKPSET